MDLVVTSSSGDAEVTVRLDDDQSSVGDLVEVITGRRSPAVVHVDGRATPSSTTVTTSGVVAGSTIDLDVPDTTPEGRDQLRIVQIAGAASTASARLGPGRYRMGPADRAGAAELASGPVAVPEAEFIVRADRSVELVEARDARLDGEAIEAPTPWAGGVLAVGARAFTVDFDESPRRRMGPAVDGAVAFNRPPRPAVASEPEPLVVPDGGGDVRAARRFPLLAVLAPIPAAVAIALLLGRPTFMLFGLLSPIMAGANWFEDRRTRKRELGDSSRADAAAIEEFTGLLAIRRRSEIERLRAAHADLAQLVERARTASPRLWEVRAEHPDGFVVSVGLGNLPFRPALTRTSSSLASADALVDGVGGLDSVPVTVDLGAERGVGFVGDRDSTLAAARAFVVGLCIEHGPADVDVVVLADPDRADEWEWAKWLPHARGVGVPSVLATDDAVSSWCDAVMAGWERPNRPSRPSHVTVVIVDDERWWRHRSAPLRPLLAEAALPIRVIAMVGERHDAPAVCTTLVEVDSGAGGGATVHRFGERDEAGTLVPYLLDGARAAEVARWLTPLDDPEVPVTGETSLPAVVPIGRMLGIVDVADIDAVAIRRRWGRAGPTGTPRVALGVSARGMVELDLVDDGPHGLIAGTTGAGKSELLRSFVIGLAANLEPDHVNFVLVDFKGGSAFDACAQLPHTVGLVTDLDEHLAGRVLRCLKAELTHREHVLRDAGASDLLSYRKLVGVAPLPRLVLVVDEFASVAAELPEFLPSLVDIAQRGRSLGIHMILATQRPAGVVDNKIKANTNLRIALRVQDDADSMDVITVRDAALLPRNRPGRAIIRLGAGDLTEIQTAYSTGRSSGDDHAGVSAEPFLLHREPTPLEHRLRRREASQMFGFDADTDGASDLDLLVGAITDAAVDAGQTEQRRPYPEPLTTELALDDLLGLVGDPPGRSTIDAGVPIGLVDLPDEQRQTPRWWYPGPDGSLVVYGIPGAGTSTALATMALGLARRYHPDDAHLYVIDADANLLAPLRSLPHCGGVVGTDDPERIARVARVLNAEITRRKARALEAGGPRVVQEQEPRIVLMIDNVGALRSALEGRENEAVWPAIEQVVRDGPTLGVCTVVSATQERALGAALASQFANRLVMRLGDPTSYTAFGLRAADIPTFVPGRAVVPDDTTEMQFAIGPEPLATTVPTWTDQVSAVRPPRRVDPLPGHVAVVDLVDAARRSESGLLAPVGLDVATAEPALLDIRLGENLIVAGAARTGRSSVLAAIAAAARTATPEFEVYGVGPRGGPLGELDGVDRPATPADVAAWVDRIVASTGPRIVLVDDIDRLGGPSFERLSEIRSDDVSIVLAGRSDTLRAPGGWWRPLHRFRTGILLQPVDGDGDILRTNLGFRLPRFARHRGMMVVDGEATPLLAAVWGDDGPSGGSS